ncbi:MAG: NnrU family protein [Pseudomonadota bacterium]|nr:NnrU family protein [Pseudomonadota bacterium]
MTFLIFGLAVFIGIHMVPSIPGMKSAFVEKIGDSGYQGAYSLVALSGLGLIIYGMMQAPFISLWVPPEWGRPVCFALMGGAVLLYTAAFLPSSIKHFTRHPMLWGTTLWAAAHLLANGDQASLLLFGGLGLFGVSKVFLIDARQPTARGERQPLGKNLILGGVAAALYALLTYFHQYLSGVAILMG